MLFIDNLVPLEMSNRIIQQLNHSSHVLKFSHMMTPFYVLHNSVKHERTVHNERESMIPLIYRNYCLVIYEFPKRIPQKNKPIV